MVSHANMVEDTPTSKTPPLPTPPTSSGTPSPPPATQSTRFLQASGSGSPRPVGPSLDPTLALPWPRSRTPRPTGAALLARLSTAFTSSGTLTKTSAHRRHLGCLEATGMLSTIFTGARVAPYKRHEESKGRLLSYHRYCMERCCIKSMLHRKIGLDIQNFVKKGEALTLHIAFHACKHINDRLSAIHSIFGSKLQSNTFWTAIHSRLWS